MGPETFLELPGGSGLQLCAQTHLKRPCAPLVWLVRQTTNTDFLPAVEPDSVGRTLLPAELTLLFHIYVLFIQYTCSTY